MTNKTKDSPKVVTIREFTRGIWGKLVPGEYVVTRKGSPKYRVIIEECRDNSPKNGPENGAVVTEKAGSCRDIERN